MVKRSISFLLSRFPAAPTLALLVIVLFASTSAIAQTFTLSLDDAPDLDRIAAPWDTLNVGPLDYLEIGEYGRVPNFLEWDFRRDRVIEEYALGGKFKTTFRIA